MNALKSFGGAMLGISIFIGLIFGSILLFTLGAQASIFAAPYIYSITGILFIINIVVLFSSMIQGTRGIAGWILFISSYIYGIATWIYGLLVTLSLWGIFAIIIGLFLGGVGVVPIGLLASIFHGRWDILFTLMALIALTYGTRILAYVLINSHSKYQQDSQFIDLEPEENIRSWKDIE